METSTKKIKITIDGKEIFPDEGMSILDAARQNHIHIPTLCHHPDISAWGGCRLCLVEVDKSPRLAAGCVTPVRDGMEIVTSNEKILNSRRTILEFLFAERNHNCMFCPESGCCELQTLAYELQMDHLTVSSSFDTFPMDITSPYMALDHNRCVLCGRCVRACQEIAGAHVLNFMNRGPGNRIGFDLNDSRDHSTCHSCGVCLQLCPTGAISNRYRAHYAVKGHDRDGWEKKEALCPLCGLLCPTTSFVHGNTLVKVEGVLTGNNDRPDRGQLCARGRFEVLRTQGQRLTHALVQNKEGNWEPADWTQAVDRVGEKLNAIRDTHGGEGIFGLASSACANETLSQFKELMTQGWKSGSLDTLDGNHSRTLSKVRSQWEESWQEASWKSIPQADFILMVGGDAFQTHPLIGSLIHRAILENGTCLAVVGKTDHLPPFAAASLAVNKGDEPLLIKAMLKQAAASVKIPSQLKKDLKETKEMDSADIFHKLGLDGEGVKIFHEMVDSFVKAENPLILAGEGLTGLKEDSGFQDVVRLARLKGFLSEKVLRLIILKPQGNSSGAWHLGISSPGENGHPKKWKAGLLLLSGEEDLSQDFSDQMGEMEFLGVITPYFPESMTRRPDIILPIPLWMEEGGTYASLDGRETLFKEPVLIPLDGVRTTQTLLAALAKKAGVVPVKAGKKSNP